ncbi:hypothetical protein INN71_14810 [Nocardioides sp. ChNu-153]|uniref:GDSL-type esterase/lipase family protein n=1 Tax=unclassified Nocardioides TaxID=2615069 RepID=UPI002406B297|nr:MULTISPECIES: GDSL-type esterase/lipase family protein [unclassified Nocardioides]MDF9716955.1 hypothetical protein [Nocardioides sp. ChNu-99]MDN7122660.1 hypothetical protein [Nocardioides sp. ChNu-153]
MVEQGTQGHRRSGEVLLPVVLAAVAVAVVLLAVVARPSVASPEPTRPPAAAPPVAQPTRVLLVGDSLTHGYRGDWTWRYRLWQLLRAERRTTYDLVGNRDDVADPVLDLTGHHDYADPDFDTDHAASGGMYLTRMRYDVPELAAATAPDVVVLLIGINDLRNGVTPGDLAAAARTFVGEVRSAAPDVDVVLAQLPHVHLPLVADYNARLDVLAAELATPASPVVVARSAGGFTAADFWDRLHPGAAGEVRIARAVHGALAELGRVTEPLPPLVLPPAGPAQAPAGLRAEHGPQGLVVGWERPAGATGYVVAHRPVGTGTWQEVRLNLPYVRASGLAPTDVVLAGADPRLAHEVVVRAARGGHVAGAGASAAVVVPALVP